MTVAPKYRTIKHFLDECKRLKYRVQESTIHRKWSITKLRAVQLIINNNYCICVFWNPKRSCYGSYDKVQKLEFEHRDHIDPAKSVFSEACYNDLLKCLKTTETSKPSKEYQIEKREFTQKPTITSDSESITINFTLKYITACDVVIVTKRGIIKPIKLDDRQSDPWFLIQGNDAAESIYVLFDGDNSWIPLIKMKSGTLRIANRAHYSLSSLDKEAIQMALKYFLTDNS